MTTYPLMPGVPAAGHVTAGGAWHPGRAEGCVKCPQSQPVKDGIYDITNARYSAGFAMRDGKRVWCAPILWKQPLSRLLREATYVGPLPDNLRRQR